MSRLNPLDLTHIRERIGQNLSRKDLVNCLRINAEWHHFFLPEIWSIIDVHPPWDYNEPQPPPYNDIENIAQHQHYIRSMSQSAQYFLDNYPTLTFPNLEHLRVYLEQQCIFSSGLLLNHPRLTRLELIGIPSRAKSFSWEPLVQLPTLTHLCLKKISVDISQDKNFWITCSTLESLELQGNSLLGETSSVATILIHLTFPKMKAFHMVSETTLSQEMQLLWFTRCPHLTSIEWITSQPRYQLRMDRMTKQFVRQTIARTWSNLQELMVENLHLSDEQIAMVIRHLCRVKKLNLAQDSFGPRAYEALHPHFPFIEELVINSDPDIPGFDSSPFLVNILVSCTQLKTLLTESIRGCDILTSPQRWACEKSLTALGAYIEVPQGSWVQERQHEIFERLSHLTNLTMLDLSDEHHHMTEETLTLTLKTGLGHLARCTRIKDFVFSGTQQCMTNIEVQWMIEHWKDLELVTGELHPHGTVCVALEEKLKRHGVSVYIYAFEYPGY
ncbi:hypothetical protein BGZ65_011786 [Modicella reniformis]|uniref:F-box domain-containing protein n=1 Tax=Modicella reniformis TaxID=1440133 RepID=A0A9P6SUS6_9FUNG|nr:hypothetical protein BGZ65_011786 [Modicella reniformis]